MTNKISDFTIEEVIEHFGEGELMQAMGFDEDLCFVSDKDLTDYVLENAFWLNIPLTEDLEFNILEQDLYDRFVDIILKNKVSYDILDNVLKNYE